MAGRERGQPAVYPAAQLDHSHDLRRRHGLYVSAILVALFCLRVLGSAWSTHFPPVFPDALNPGRTDTYYAVAGLTPFNPAFYWAARPFVYPAFLWLLGRNSLLVVVGQMAVYCGAFAVLCVTARQVLRTRAVANTAVVLLLLLAVEGRFVLWNTQILSESLGLSLGILMIGLWWRATADPSPGRVSWAWAATVAWLLERDAHSVPVLVVVVPVALAVGFLARRVDREVRRRLFVGSVVAVVACGYLYACQRVSHRNVYAFDNNIGLRILPDPGLRAWFVAGGMPLDAALDGRRGKSAFDDNRAFVNDPSLARFRKWADGPGSRRILVSLVVRSPDWYRMFAKQAPSAFAYDYQAYDSYGVLHRLPARMPFQLGGPKEPGALIVWLLLVGGVFAWAGVSGSPLHRRLMLFGAAGLLVVFVDLYASFVGDALEVERHLVGALNRLGAVLIICLAIGVDAIWQARRAPSHDTEVESGRVPAPY